MRRIIDAINWQSIKQYASISVSRFPIACAALAVLATVLIVDIQSGDIISESLVVKIVFTSLFAVWLSVGAQLVGETMGVSLHRRMLVMLGTVIVVGGYYASFPSDLTSVPFEFVAVHIALHTMLGIALLSGPSWAEWYRGKYTDTHWYAFSFNTTLYAIQAAAVAVLLIALGSLLLFTVDSLFDPTWFDGDLYLQWFVVSGILAGPIYFLSMLPNSLENILAVGERFVHLVIRYIALPFIYIYFVILYLYTVKVLFGLPEWPQGEVAILVIYFSFFSYVVYLFSYHLENETWIAHTRKLIPILLVPQIAMLFYSIGVRIEEYGWTINRYLVVLLGLYLAVMSLYHMYRYYYVPRLVMIPTTLCVAIAIALIGPWSMYAVSEQSQTHRLETMLQNIDMLDEAGELRGLSSAELEALSDKQVRDITSAIRYLCDYHGCDSLRAVVPGEFLDTIASEREDGLTSYAITEEMNLPAYVPTVPGQKTYLHAYASDYLADLDIADYTHLYSFTTNRDNDQANKARYDAQTGELVIARDAETLRIPAQQGMLQLLEKNGESMGPLRKDGDTTRLDFAVVHSGVRYYLSLSRISGERVGEDIQIDFVQGVVLY
jgi:hypothetical protein